MPIILTPALGQEYKSLFASCQVRPEEVSQVGKVKDKIVANRSRYSDGKHRCSLVRHRRDS